MYSSPRSATKFGWVTIVTSIACSAPMSSGGITAPCSMRSPPRAPALSSAATVRTSCVRVTQWTATLRCRAVRFRDPRFEVGQPGEVVIVEEDLDRAAGQSGAGDVHPFGCHRVHALRQTAVEEGADQILDVARCATRIGVGEPGDAPRRGEASDGREVERRPRRHGCEPGVHPPDAARRGATGCALDAGSVVPGGTGTQERLTVQDPELAAAVLDPDGADGFDLVEHRRIERPRHRLVVPDRSDPTLAGLRARTPVRRAGPPGCAPTAVRRGWTPQRRPTPGGGRGGRAGRGAARHSARRARGRRVPRATETRSPPLRPGRCGRLPVAGDRPPPRCGRACSRDADRGRARGEHWLACTVDPDLPSAVGARHVSRRGTNPTARRSTRRRPPSRRREARRRRVRAHGQRRPRRRAR